MDLKKAVNAADEECPKGICSIRFVLRRGATGTKRIPLIRRILRERSDRRMSKIRGGLLTVLWIAIVRLFYLLSRFPLQRKPAA